MAQLLDVAVLVAELDEEVRAGLRAAQVRQVMVNPSPAGDSRPLSSMRREGRRGSALDG